MSGLVTGLQNRLRRFESARHLTSERYPLPQRISFFFIPNRYFSRCGFNRYLVGAPMPRDWFYNSPLNIYRAGKWANIWGKGWERMRESWQTFEGREFHFLLAAEILAYGTRAVSWLMFSPLSVTKWPTYHTIPSKFASNREILFCANEPKKREKASKWGVKTWNLRPEST